MYLTRNSMGDQWMWTVYGIAIRGGMIDGDVPHGLEDTREQAMSKFKAAWERVKRHNGEPPQ
jgi:hypothetical protein